jgi:hypothetical protein
MNLREQFEASMRPPRYVYWSGGKYMTSVAHLDCLRYQGAWEGWKAARSDIAIELPAVGPAPDAPEDAIDDSHMDEYHAAIGMRNSCIEAIEAAGLKVKP